MGVGPICEGGFAVDGGHAGVVGSGHADVLEFAVADDVEDGVHLCCWRGGRGLVAVFAAAGENLLLGDTFEVSWHIEIPNCALGFVPRGDAVVLDPGAEAPEIVVLVAGGGGDLEGVLGAVQLVVGFPGRVVEVGTGA